MECCPSSYLEYTHCGDDMEYLTPGYWMPPACCLPQMHSAIQMYYLKSMKCMFCPNPSCCNYMYIEY